eukprot:scaffold2180_cov59-Cylindrotheca_fusiformis.AAC.1
MGVWGALSGNPNSKEGQFCGMSDETFGKEAVPARDSQESEVSRFQNSILTHMNLFKRLVVTNALVTK